MANYTVYPIAVCQGPRTGHISHIAQILVLLSTLPVTPGTSKVRVKKSLSIPAPQLRCSGKEARPKKI